MLPILPVDPRRASASDGDLHPVPERVGQRGVVLVVEERAQGAGRRLWACVYEQPGAIGAWQAGADGLIGWMRHTPPARG
jgi:hypothetical protein